MVKIKKISLVLLSMLFCVTMYGCGTGEKSEQKNNQEAVAAEFAKAIEQYKSAKFEHCVDTIDVSSPSILEDVPIITEGYLTQWKWDDRTVYEIKKDSEGKATDEKIIKELSTETMTFSDGKTESVTTAYKDGYMYYLDSKFKIKHEYKFKSFEYTEPHLNIDNIEDITLTKDGSKNIFKFKLKQDPILARLSATGFIIDDSNVKLVDYSGQLIVDTSNETVRLILNIEFKNQEDGATFKNVIDSECSENVPENVPELEFPSDLDSYQDFDDLAKSGDASVSKIIIR